MKTFIVVSGFCILSCAFSPTAITGTVSGTLLKSSSPYIFTQSMTIEDGDTLIIEPGVTARFGSGTRLTVRGTLLAEGIATDSIRFESNSDSPAPGDWTGLYFDQSDSGTVLAYCTVSHGGYRVQGRDWKWLEGNISFHDTEGYVKISHCRLSHSLYNGVHHIGKASPAIANCLINNNVVDGIACESDSSNPTIIGCEIRSNGDDGLGCGDNDVFPLVSDCSFTDNADCAIAVFVNGVNSLLGPFRISGNGQNAILVRQGSFKKCVTGRWRNFGVPYVIGDGVGVLENEVLTIDPGTQIRFDSGTTLSIRGTLIAQGTESDSIRFESNADVPAPGDWVGLYFDQCATGTIMEYCAVSHAGKRIQGRDWEWLEGNVSFHDVEGNVTLSHCRLSHSLYSGIWHIGVSSPIISNCLIHDNAIHGIACHSTDSNPTITGCFIRSNGDDGISCSDNDLFPQVSDCSIMNNGDYAIALFVNGANNLLGPFSISGNGQNAILIRQGSFNKCLTGRWRNFGVPYIVHDGVGVLDNEVLTIDPGVRIRFDPETTLSVKGRLVARGTKADSIRFESNAITPAPGDWVGLYFNSSDVGTIIEYCVVRHAGFPIQGTNWQWLRGNVNVQDSGHLVSIQNCEVAYSLNSGIYLNGASSPTVTGCSIHHNQLHGIYCPSAGANPPIKDCRIYSNTDRGVWCSGGAYPEIQTSRITGNAYGITASGASPVIHFNDLYDNINFDVENVGSQNVDARQNYWGDETTLEMATGTNPKDITAIFDVHDDASRGLVDYADWLSNGLAVYYATPNNFKNDGIYSVTIRGRNFSPAAMVKLAKPGLQDIVGTQVSVEDSSCLLAQFDLTGRQLGVWDIVVNDTSGNVILEQGFTIGEGYINFSVDVVGRSQVRYGRTYECDVFVENTGNVTSQFVFLTITMPAEFDSFKVYMQDSLIAIFSGDDGGFGTLLKNNTNAGALVGGIAMYGIQSGHSAHLHIDTGISSITSGVPVTVQLTSGDFFGQVIKLTGEKSIELECEPNFDDIIEAFKEELKKVAKELMNDPEIYRSLTEWLNEMLGEKIDNVYINVMDNVMDKMAEIVENHSEFKDEYEKLKSIYDQLKKAEELGEKLAQNIIVLTKDSPEWVSEEEILEIFGVNSRDPNEKTGLSGIGENGFITLDKYIPYTIYFENVDSATAAAQEIEILDTLHTNFDWGDFKFRNVQIGDTSIDVSALDLEFSKTVPWNDTTEVHINGSFDSLTGIIRWYLRGTDTRTGEWGDFLPPNVYPPEGEGHVSFSISTKQDLVTGSTITNRASIIFDVNPAILTNDVFNTVDAGDPASSVTAVSDSSSDAAFTVHWSGSDDPDGSGIRHYSIYAAEDGGAYSTWHKDTSDTAATFEAEGNHAYWFYSIAKDSVGNLESQPAVPDFFIWNAAYEFPRAGWQLAALSNVPVNDSLHVLFPTALGGLSWNAETGAYEAQKRLTPSKGYWLAIPSPTNDYIAAPPLHEYTVHLQCGWFLIGGLAAPVDFSDPDDSPDGAVLVAYGWDADAQKYERVTTLLPNIGYWIAVLQECDLTVGEEVSLAKSGAVANHDQKISQFYAAFGALPPSPPVFPGFEDKDILPSFFELYPNFPNPFNTMTKIKYALPEESLVTVAIYNILGQHVVTLVDEKKEAGYYDLLWDGRNSAGLKTASGVYVIRMEAGDFIKTRKLLLLK